MQTLTQFVSVPAEQPGREWSMLRMAGYGKMQEDHTRRWELPGLLTRTLRLSLASPLSNGMGSANAWNVSIFAKLFVAILGPERVKHDWKGRTVESPRCLSHRHSGFLPSWESFARGTVPKYTGAHV